MLRLENVSVTLGAFTLAADLDLARGRRLAVLGASGSGKSTLLNLIAGFLIPDQGQVLIDGVEQTHAPVSALPLSILFQDGNLFPHLSVFDNVALALRTDLSLGEDDRAQVMASLAQVGMDSFADRKPADLSGGQQSRVALARILLRDRPLMLMDEPVAALDPGLRREVLALTKDLAERAGLTLIMVTHDLRDAEALATDLCLLEAGRITLTGALPDLLVNPPDALAPWL